MFVIFRRPRKWLSGVWGGRGANFDTPPRLRRTTTTPHSPPFHPVTPKPSSHSRPRRFLTLALHRRGGKTHSHTKNTHTHGARHLPSLSLLFPHTLLLTSATLQARFNAPLGVLYFTDKCNEEHLFVTDGGNDRIRRVFPSAPPSADAAPAVPTATTVTTVAGGHPAGGLRDGKGAAAAFKAPEGMAAMTWPTLVVADAGTTRCARWT